MKNSPHLAAVGLGWAGGFFLGIALGVALGVAITYEEDPVQCHPLPDDTGWLCVGWDTPLSDEELEHLDNIQWEKDQ